MFFQKIMNSIPLKILEFIYGEMRMNILVFDVDQLGKMELVVTLTMINFQLNVFQKINGLQGIQELEHTLMILT